MARTTLFKSDSFIADITDRGKKGSPSAVCVLVARENELEEEVQGKNNAATLTTFQKNLPKGS